MKKLIGLTVICLLLPTVVLAQTVNKKVAVFIDRESSIHSRVSDNFINGISYQYKKFNLDDFDSDFSAATTAISRYNPDLIVAIGPKTAQLAKDEFTSIPVVFTLVSNPHYYNLDAPNVCGIRLNVSPRDQFSTLKDVAPGVEKIGVIYNPDRAGAFIDEAKAAAADFGLSIVAQEVQAKNEVPEAVRAIENKVDAMWIITDPVVANAVVLQKLLLVSLSYKIPLFCPAKPFVERGCLFCLNVEYKKLGSQAADLANSIITGVTTPGEVGFIYPDDVELVINSKIAEKLDLSLSSDIKSKASEIIEK
jgi:putative ABC transport system substrate-binding protein